MLDESQLLGQDPGYKSCKGHVMVCVYDVCKRRARKRAQHYVIRGQIEQGKGLEPPVSNIGETFFSEFLLENLEKNRFFNLVFSRC